MKMLLLSALIFLIVISSVSYAQENFLYIIMDLSSENVITDSNYNVKEFSVTNYINKIGEEYLFTFSYNSEYDFDDFRIKIILPEESIISKQEESLVLSRPVKLSTDGTRIYLEWSGVLKKNQDFTAFAQYSAKKNVINYYMIFCIIAIIVAFIGGYGFKKFKKEKFIK
ncbi:MAG: hypothetical protein KKA41_17350, partial [Proteobacteria bacterium]|nr:hypothetical protein [Pseudomonadota bacterium]